MPDNLYQRGQTWWARIKVKGRDYRRSLRTTSLGEARKRLTKFREDMDHLAFNGEARHTWKEAVVHYVEDILPKAVKPRTADRYLTSIRMVAPHLDHLYLDEINRKAIGGLVRKRGQEKASNATIRRDLTAVSRVLSASIAQGWIDTNPAKEWDRDVIPERRDPLQRISDDDMAAFLAKAPDGFGRVALFLLQTGMRQMEAVTLERAQLVMATNEIRLTATKTRPRVIVASDSAWGTIRGTPARLDCSFVFTSERGGPFHNYASRFKEIANRAGTKFRCHDLRHEFAIRELESGRDIYDLSRHLGHSSVKTTEGYLDYVDSSGAQTRAQRRRFSGAKGSENAG
ncbi:MAG: tyrosine-type recombinase/integrase [Alphaproteobacteria bacterium]|nr:tyrosine-type recombinase/integrase [Alphaproteobacteria bacterium]